jgi:hypothetical protein
MCSWVNKHDGVPFDDLSTFSPHKRSKGIVYYHDRESELKMSPHLVSGARTPASSSSKVERGTTESVHGDKDGTVKEEIRDLFSDFAFSSESTRQGQQGGSRSTSASSSSTSRKRKATIKKELVQTVQTEMPPTTAQKIKNTVAISKPGAKRKKVDVSNDSAVESSIGSTTSSSITATVTEPQRRSRRLSKET